MAEGASGKPKSLVWERIDPGHYQAKALLTPGTWLRGAAQVGAFTVPFGPITAATNPEWALNRERVRELEAVSRVSGGAERVDLSGVWQAPRRQEYMDARPWIFTALMFVFLADVLFTRMGWKMPVPARPKFPAPKRPKIRPAAVAREKSPLPRKAPVAPVAAVPPPADTNERRSRFRRAKKGGD